MIFFANGSIKILTDENHLTGKRLIRRVNSDKVTLRLNFVIYFASNWQQFDFCRSGELSNMQDEPIRDEDEIDLLDLFFRLWRRKYIIVGGTAIITLAVLAISMAKPKKQLMAMAANESLSLKYTK